MDQSNEVDVLLKLFMQLNFITKICKNIDNLILKSRVGNSQEYETKC